MAIDSAWTVPGEGGDGWWRRGREMSDGLSGGQVLPCHQEALVLSRARCVSWQLVRACEEGA